MKNLIFPYVAALPCQFFISGSYTKTGLMKALGLAFC